MISNFYKAHYLFKMMSLFFILHSQFVISQTTSVGILEGIVLDGSNDMPLQDAVVKILDEDSLQLSFQELSNESYFFKSFNDHRIAMACSIFAFDKPITIDDESVVQKSFPNYWNVFRAIFRDCL